MMKVKLLIFAFLMAFILYSCSKKSHPDKGTGGTVIKDSSSVAKAPVKTRPKTTIPKVIVVNDAAAKKSVDGRLYYDLQGRRYWRNYKDGKYYLFNKSMYTDDAFKPVTKN